MILLKTIVHRLTLRGRGIGFSQILVLAATRFWSFASYWGPPLLWMAGITYFSSRSDPLGPLSSSKFSGVIGNFAHLAEYAGLAILLYRAWASGPMWGQKNVSATKTARMAHQALALSFATSLFFAVLDELHQAFVPGREADLSDIALDALGSGLGLMVIWFGGWKPQSVGQMR